MLRIRLRSMLIVVAIVAVTIWAVRSAMGFFPPRPDHPLTPTVICYDKDLRLIDCFAKEHRRYFRDLAAWEYGDAVKQSLRRSILTFFGFEPRTRSVDDGYPHTRCARPTDNRCEVCERRAPRW